MASVSFIIPCLNSASTIVATLEGILASQLPPDQWEIIVVDNGSTDETVQLASRYPVTITSCGQRGAGPARNHGARLATGEFLAFIDSDVVVEPDWATELLALFDQGYFAATLGRVIPAGGGTFLNDYRRALNNRRYVGTNISLFSPDGIGPVINTAACMYRKNVFLSLGGFDERMKRLEDTELSCRLFSLGGTIAATTRARAHVSYVDGVLSYIQRSFKLGCSRFQMTGVAGRERWDVVKELTQELVNHDLSMFTPEQKLFFWINTLANYFGFLSSLLGERITPIGPPLNLGAKILKSHSFVTENGTYGLTSNGRFMRVEKSFYFFSMNSGEWQAFSEEHIPWEKLTEMGILHRTSL